MRERLKTDDVVIIEYHDPETNEKVLERFGVVRTVDETSETVNISLPPHTVRHTEESYAETYIENVPDDPNITSRTENGEKRGILKLRFP